MTGTRTAPVINDCARCVHNSLLLVGVIYCEAKIALSNSLAVIAVFLLANDRGICEAFMSLSFSLFCSPELELLCLSNVLHLLYYFCISAILLHSWPTVHVSVPVLHCYCTCYTVPESV
jgi:hypothetical protein